jgi:hypothetical protein
MAIATSSNYYNSAIVGQPMVGADINVHDRHNTPHYAVGFGFQRSDGNCFRYVQYGAAVVAGALVGNVATNSNLASTNALVVAPATAVAVVGEIIRPGAIGSKYAEIILTTVANNQFAGGILVTTKDTGIGYTYRIRGNTATGNPATGNFRAELYEPIKIALDNTTDIAIAAPKYANLAANTFVQGTTANIVGVSMAAASNNDYGWVCTRGIVGAVAAGADSGIGNVAALSLTTGTYEQYITTTSLAFQHLGTIQVASAGAGQLGIINIKLE